MESDYSEGDSSVITQLAQGGAWSLSREAIIAAVLVSILTIVVARSLFGKKSKLPPGPRPWPIIGNILQIGTSPQHSLTALSKIYGPIMYMHLGSYPLVVVSSAEAAMEFHKTHDKSFAGRPPSISGEIFSNHYTNIVVAPYGPYWRHLRKICTLELFTSKRLDAFRPPRTDEVNHMVSSIMDDIQKGKVVELNVKLGHLATNNITRMMLNKRFFGLDTAGQGQAHRFKELVFTLFSANSALIVGDFIPWLSWVTYASGYVAYMRKVKKDIDEFLQTFVESKKGGLARKGADEIDEDSKDFVDVLLSMPSADGKGQLSDETIKSVIQDMLLAGTDTSSNTVEWAVAALLRHPDVMKKAQAELDAVVGCDRPVDETDIVNLPYLQAVVKEVFRLYPPAPLSLPHMSIEPCTVRGYDIPANTRMFLNAYAIQRDPASWERPLEFDPERFVKNPEIDMKGNHFQLLPFGAGRRICPGMPLGILFVQIGLARLVHSFNFKLPNNQDPKDLDMTEKFGVTMPRANPLHVIGEPRLPAHCY